ncbi:MAG TPA: radical SAM protein [Gemmatimonadaceae bacterium]|jgi:anaerobic magnesium-protoporphyrin IX monomethyl ester cyclase|nr:radical SAM protein [Gemmatimonadaceae bacterium]
MNVTADRLTAPRRIRQLTKSPVLLVTPPSIFLLDERVFLALGILKVAAVLEQAGGHVENLDLSGVAEYLDALSAHLAATQATVVAITATTPQLPAVTKIVERIRADRPDMRVICGGPHPTLVWAACKLERKSGRVGRAHRALGKLEAMFDTMVAGDGEIAIFEALKPDAPKVIDADELGSGMFMTNADYELMPMPARHLADVESYRYTIDGHKACNLIAQLGCPMGCNFCAGRHSKMLRKIRTRSTPSIIAEIEHLYRTYGYTGFMLLDDELNVNKQIVELMNAIADLQQRLGVEFGLRGFIKSELFTEEQAVAMRRAGFRWLLCGFEAADDRVLVNIQKNATLEDNTRVMEIAAKHDLKVKALMSVGHAGETAGSIQAVADWLLQVKPADFDCTVITPYPGSPYYDEAVAHPDVPDAWTFTAKKTGDRLHAFDVDYTQVADYYKGDPDGGYHSYVFTDALSGEEIVRMRDEVEKTVRGKLGISFNHAAPAKRFEHSMGQGALPDFILRTTR